MKYTRIRLVVIEPGEHNKGETGIRVIDHKHPSAVSEDEGKMRDYYNSVLRDYRNEGYTIVSHSMKEITREEYYTNNYF
jgi:hypothetical protein